MRAKKNPSNGSAEKTVRAIRRATRRRYAAEEKIRMVLEGFCGEESIAELCRRLDCGTAPRARPMCRRLN